MKVDYDVWSDGNGRLKSEVARKLFVDDKDAPYLYLKHEIRVTAKDGNDAIKQFRKAKKSIIGVNKQCSHIQ